MGNTSVHQGSGDKYNWMSHLPDSISIRQVSIPGTHNSGTYPGYGGPMVQCQNWTLREQLDSGIRYLDIRGRHTDDKLFIHHGQAYQHLTMTDIVNDCMSFLSNNDTEFILMRISKEHTDPNNTRNYADTLDTYLHGGRRFWIKKEIPTVKEARGKVVILDDFPGPGRGISYGRAANIEDDYNVPTVLPISINHKWDGIKRHLNSLKQDKLNIVYTSGASGGAYPNAVADRINPRLDSYLDGRSYTGIIAMDFPYQSLVNKIIRSN